MSIYTNSRVAAINIINKFANENAATIERKTLTPDGGGGFTEAWNTLYSGIKCAMIPMSGSEIYDAHRLNYEATHICYAIFGDAPDVKSDDRILFDGRVFDIKDPQNIAEADAAFAIKCMEGVGS